MKRPFERLRCCGRMSDCTRERDPSCAAGSSAENDSHAATSCNDTPGHTQETNALSAISARNVSCGVTTSRSITKHTSTQRACERRLSQGSRTLRGIRRKNAVPRACEMGGNRGQHVLTSRFRVNYSPADHYSPSSTEERWRT